MSSWFSLIVCVPFPFGVWGRMWNSIVSVPVLDHCLFINFSIKSNLLFSKFVVGSLYF